MKNLLKKVLNTSLDVYNSIPDGIKGIMVEENIYKYEDEIYAKIESKIIKGKETEDVLEKLQIKLKCSSKDIELLCENKDIHIEFKDIGDVTLIDYLYAVSQIDTNFLKNISIDLLIDKDVKTFEDIRNITNSNMYEIKGDPKLFDVIINKNLIADNNEQDNVLIMAMITSIARNYKNEIPQANNEDAALMYMLKDSSKINYQYFDLVTGVLGYGVGITVGLVTGVVLTLVIGGTALLNVPKLFMKIGGKLGALVGFMASGWGESGEKAQVRKAGKELYDNVLSLNKYVLSKNRETIDFITQIAREQRKSFRKILADAALKDGLKVYNRQTAYNLIALNEVAKIYKQDCTNMVEMLKNIKLELFTYSTINNNDNDKLDEINSMVFKYSPIIQMAVPDTKVYYETTIKSWLKFNELSRNYRTSNRYFNW
ncbi:hypothetical protein [Clostridium estertheticum]|uniref:Uncharacterized protein n=1 Tax=Clostridium estertheticum TaxID=238834 RepID=A0A7Y3SZY5_9CLOT|nr:hypothetical protein [Clostridium estertheticum]NNU78347.1 hypothetical protein [Clostridium estertheticum]WBL45299.1 hypothetical protein LOR37_11345 [Clostridium estertheticum]